MKGDVLSLGYKKGGRVQQPFVLVPSQNTIVCNDLQEKASPEGSVMQHPDFSRGMVGSELVEWSEGFTYIVDKNQVSNSKYQNGKE